MTATDVLNADPYGTAARDYIQRGYIPLPLPKTAKTPPPAGYTGSGGATPTETQYEQWIVNNADGNIAIRLTGDVIGIDVDHYTTKNGEQKFGLDDLAELETKLGPLPATIMTTSRTNGAGIRLYRIPMGTILRSALSPSIETIQRHHRYAIVAPSIHPETGDEYRWIKTDTGEVFVDPWDVEDLTPLPDPYIEHFQTDNTEQRSDTATRQDVDKFTAEHQEQHKPAALAGIRGLLAKIHANNKGRHDTLIDVSCVAMREAAAGFYTVTEAKETLNTWWRTVIGNDHQRANGTEFDNAIGWAIGQALHDPKSVTRIAELRASLDYDPTALAGKEPTATSGDIYVGRDGLLAEKLAAAVTKLGAIRTDISGSLWHYRDGVWKPNGHTEVTRRCRNLLGERFRNAHVNTIHTWLAADEPFIMDSEPTDVLNFRNGLLNWRNGELTAHRENLPSTYQLPHNWNPEATCPTFDEWLTQVFPKDAIEFAWELIGYLLYPANPFHRSIMLHGSGRNGKSTLLRLIRHAIGGTQVSSVTLQQLGEDRFAGAQLYRKVANIAGDLDARSIKQTDLFKMATGEDSINAERKYGQPFNFTNHATFLFAANELPGSSDVTEGFFSRWLVVPFNGYFPEGIADKTLPDRLLAEVEGVIVKAMPALRRLLDRGAFEIPTSVLESTSEFRSKADQVRQFADERLDIDIDGRIARPALYMVYKDWCDECGHHPLARRRFADRLKAIRPNVQVIKSRGNDYITGLRLVDRLGDSGGPGDGFSTLPPTHKGKLEPRPPGPPGPPNSPRLL